MQNPNSQILYSLLASNPLKLESNMDRNKKATPKQSIDGW